ncbi:hypothetical protein SMF913_13147 [Streptomyces malaysiensis]|uniref:Uncharacterized protein n=1 Tax=Streptomyces malaysiensis TaxID=92644 RepID=A0A2J7ZA19_STRMQ|nr:hypothetical protein SMF913_13147 [Streptomyces malaysiensis]
MVGETAAGGTGRPLLRPVRFDARRAR